MQRGGTRSPGAGGGPGGVDSPSGATNPGAGTFRGEYDEYMDLLGDLLTPSASALFDELRRDLRGEAAPLPEHVRARLRPFFAGERAGPVELSAAAVDQAVFVVDPERMRPLFALAPEAVAAITLGDVIVFPHGQYRPDCIEGLALIGHELVHVAQYRALGRDRFLEHYFLTETLERLLGGALSGEPVDLSTNRLEIDAYCHQERICRALERTGSLAACDGRDIPACRSCPPAEPAPAVSPAAPGPRASPSGLPEAAGGAGDSQAGRPR